MHIPICHVHTHENMHIHICHAHIHTCVCVCARACVVLRLRLCIWYIVLVFFSLLDFYYYFLKIYVCYPSHGPSSRPLSSLPSLSCLRLHSLSSMSFSCTKAFLAVTQCDLLFHTPFPDLLLAVTQYNLYFLPPFRRPSLPPPHFIRFGSQAGSLKGMSHVTFRTSSRVSESGSALFTAGGQVVYYVLARYLHFSDIFSYKNI